MTDTIWLVGRTAFGAASFVLLGSALALVPACSSKNTATPVDAGPAPCVSAECLPNNHSHRHGDRQRVSLPVQGARRLPVRLPLRREHGTAPSPTASPTSTPTRTRRRSATGAPPAASTGGFDKNPACGSAQGFWCYGTSPTDASAFCTVYGCKEDADCGDGFYCV